MISNSVQVTNVMNLGVHYLKRFFAHIGPIVKLQKDDLRNVLIVEYENQESAVKAMAYNGRVLDKKPIHISRYFEEGAQPGPKSFHSAKKQQRENSKEKGSKGKMATVPCLEVPKDSKHKIPIRSSYRVIEHDDVDDHIIHFISNPLQGFKCKGELWKAILYEITHNTTRYEQETKELILSATMGIWTLTQLKIRQVRYFIEHGENQITKYLDNFMQELVVNKLCLIRNRNLVNKGHSFKSEFADSLIRLEFKLPYHDDTEEECKHLCTSNKQMHFFLYYLYSFSDILGKIYHNLYANSLITFEAEELTSLTRIFNDQIFEENYKEMSEHTYMSSEEQQPRFSPKETLNSFTGDIENIGHSLFDELKMLWQSNSVIWLEIENKKLNERFPYPGFFYCNLRLSDCQGKILPEHSFLNYYECDHDKEDPKVQQVAELTLGRDVIVFEESQFSIDQVVDFSIKCMRYLRKSSSLQPSSDDEKQLEKRQQPKQQKKESQTSRFKRDDRKLENQGSSQEIVLRSDSNWHGRSLSLHVIYMLNSHRNIQEKETTFIKASKILNNPKYWSKIFNIEPEHRSYQIKIRFSVIALIPSKHQEFNAFRCEAYLINYLNHYVYEKNQIISSKEYAGILASKILSQLSGKRLYGFSDKEYVEKELWRLYQKCGQRRIKMKIQEQYTKRHANKKVKR